LLLVLSAPAAQPDVVVVCPPPLRAALEPWAAYRTHQGHVLAFVSQVGNAEDIRGRIREVAKGGKVRFVVLVGDADPRAADDPAVRARCVPVHYAKAKVNTLWGSEPQIATDHPYGSLDGNQKPELAVGRLTADSPEELRRIVAKILAYERSTDFGPWRRQLNFVAGVGGFGLVADMVLESAARYFLTENIPAAYRVSMTYGSWRSPYCPDPREFHDAALERLNEGSWCWVYIGHGSRLALDHVRVPGGPYPILSVEDMAKLRCAHAGPIAVFLSCYAGAIDAQPDCLAEQMLREDGGPVAVIAGSRVTMPYAMTVMAAGLMEEMFRKQCPTVGEGLLHAKQNMLKEPGQGDAQRAILDALAAALSPAPKQLADERAEHLLLFNLIGDPLLRLKHPQPIRLEAPATVTAGTPLEVAGTCPIRGRGTIELVVRRGRLTFSAPARREYPASGGLSEFQEVYRKANDPRLASAPVTVADGRFTARLDVPEDASGSCHVCAFVEGADGFALGSADVTIQSRPRPNDKR